MTVSPHAGMRAPVIDAEAHWVRERRRSEKGWLPEAALIAPSSLGPIYARRRRNLLALSLRQSLQFGLHELHDEVRIFRAFVRSIFHPICI